MIRRALGWSAGLYILWTAATYLLEGRLLTLLRPEAVAARVTYVVLANMLIGTLGALWALRRLVDSGTLNLDQIGFRPTRRIAIGVAAGTALGLAAYLLQGAPSLDPLVVLNGFSQTLPISIAELLVCWAVVVPTVEGLLRRRGRWLRFGAAAVAAAFLFGIYHIAHSPPFNSLTIILLLSAIGLVTSAFFLVTREIYGAIFFHNFLAAFGVIAVLAQAEVLEGYKTPQFPLYMMAGIAFALLIGADRYWLRRRTG